MAGSRNRLEMHTFYCINCGKPGIPIWRKTGSQRERYHRKILYCLNCRQKVNHIEIRTEEEAEQFKNEFSNGKYREEAAAAIAYEKEHGRKE